MRNPHASSIGRLIVLALLASPGAVQADVTRIEITTRVPFAEGHAFGAAGDIVSVSGTLTAGFAAACGGVAGLGLT